MPASSSAIRAGRAFVELFADDSQMVRVLKTAEKKLKAFGATITKIGASISAAGGAILTPMLGAAKAFADAGSNLVDMSGRTGVAVERLSELKFAADQSGTSMEGVEKSIRKMQKNLVDAADGSKTANDALAALGLTVGDLQGKSPDEQFLAIGEALSHVQDPTERAARAMEIFGKSGAELLPFFSNGAAGVRDLMKEAQRLGITMSTEDAVAAEAFGDILQKVQDIVARTVVSVGAALGPTLARLAEQFSGGAASIGEWVNANRETIRVVAAVAAGLVAAGVAISVVGAGFTALGTVVGIVATGIATVGAVLGAILSPVGLVTAALVGGVAAWFAYSDSGQQALSFIAERFGAFKDDAAKAFQGVVDALKAGDIALAGEIAMAGLQVVWTHGWNSVVETVGFTVGVIIGAWEQLGAMIHKIWLVSIEAIVNTLANVGAAIQAFFENAAGQALVFLGIITEAERAAAAASLARNREDAVNSIARDFDSDREIALIDKVLADAAAARARGNAEEIKAAEASLDAARKRLADSIKQASEARAAADAATSPDGPKKIQVTAPDLDEISDKLGGAAEKMVQAQNKLPEVMTLGSREAAEALLRHEFGRDGQDEKVQREQLKVQRDQLRVLRDLDRNGRNAPQLAVANLA